VVAIAYRATVKTVASVVFNGTDNLTRDVSQFGNTMGTELWSIKNPSVAAGNIVVTYADGGVYVWDAVCAMAFSSVTKPPQATGTYTASDASAGISLPGLTSTTDNAIFIDVASCNCGALVMTNETNRTLQMNYGPYIAGVSTIITKTGAGNDTMPWKTPATAATAVGAVYPPVVAPAPNGLATNIR